MHSPLTTPATNGASLRAAAASPGASGDYLLPATLRGAGTQAVTALGLLAGLWVAVSPWFLTLQERGSNATVADLIAGLAVAGVAVIALAGPRGYPGLEFGSALLGIWVIVSPFILHHHGFSVTHQMYWSNSWAGGVLIATALAGLSLLRRPVR